MDATKLNKSAVQAAAPRSFPLLSTDLYRMLTDAEFKQKFHARLEKGNSFIVLMYKLRILPLFGLGRQIMLLTTRGRKSGKLRDTPIGYFRIDGVIHVFSGWGKEANWYKNIAANPAEIFLQVGFRRSPARAEFLSDPAKIQQTLEKLVVQNPKGAGYLMGWDAGIDRPETADFSLMIERVLVVRFFPK